MSTAIRSRFVWYIPAVILIAVPGTPGLRRAVAQNCVEFLPPASEIAGFQSLERRVQNPDRERQHEKKADREYRVDKRLSAKDAILELPSIDPQVKGPDRGVSEEDSSHGS